MNLEAVTQMLNVYLLQCYNVVVYIYVYIYRYI